MLINQNTVITGHRVILIPYRKEHVPKYHEWMKCEQLQKLTASEPLTLDEEYEMQASWQKDDDKCTFIILHKGKYESSGNEIESMIGDTNLFFVNPEDRLCAEAEIMIAEQWARRQKCGWESMLLMLLYGITELGVKQFVVKVSFSNVPSIQMFQQLGFSELSKSAVFEEITFSKRVDQCWTQYIRDSLGGFSIPNVSTNE